MTVRRIGGPTPTPPSRREPESEETRLAKEVKAHLEEFIGDLKNLNALSAKSASYLASFAEHIKDLNQASSKAAKL
jgi:hypothetical protein